MQESWIARKYLHGASFESRPTIHRQHEVPYRMRELAYLFMQMSVGVERSGLDAFSQRLSLPKRHSQAFPGNGIDGSGGVSHQSGKLVRYSTQLTRGSKCAP